MTVENEDIAYHIKYDGEDIDNTVVIQMVRAVTFISTW
jgi:hypothetical protein